MQIIVNIIANVSLSIIQKSKRLLRWHQIQNTEQTENTEKRKIWKNSFQKECAENADLYNLVLNKLLTKRNNI